jgi:hypothetical protein
MSTELLFGWGAWAVFLLAMLIYWAEIGFDIYSHKPVYIADAFRALACTLATSWFFVLPDWNKLHLLWLALAVLSIGDWIEYRRLPPVTRMMRRWAGPQPIKVRPILEIRWVSSDRPGPPAPPRQLGSSDVAGIA